jgi:hypothetical protein
MRVDIPAFALASICAALLVVLGWMLALPEIPLPKILAAAKPYGAGTNATSGETMAARPDYDEISKRPPFSPTRRPLPPPAAKPVSSTQPVKPLPSLVLLGTIVSEGEQIAFIRISGQSHGQAVRVHEHVGDWIVSEIVTNRIILESGPLRHVVALDTSVSPPSSSGISPSRPPQIRR